jgi:hypothetical protein
MVILGRKVRSSKIYMDSGSARPWPESAHINSRSAICSRGQELLGARDMPPSARDREKILKRWK